QGVTRNNRSSRTLAMSSIIKATGAGTASGGAYQFEEIASPPVSSSNQAASLIAEAQAEADTIRKRAIEEGRAQGRVESQRLLEEAASRQLATLTSALSAAVDGIADAKSAYLAHWEKAAIHVAVAIAGRIIRRELDRSPEITLTLVKEALELASGSGDLQVR